MTQNKLQQAMFGAGCFWGVEALFRKTPGVVDAAVGYAGGSLANPTYQQVCTDKTGHAEVVWLQFDPTQVSYKQLLEIFFANHNPTTLNRQGPDVGTQYRSAIFYYDEDQQREAEQVKLDIAVKWPGKTIVTEILPAPVFYRAEEYHQQYLKKKGVDHCGIL